MRKTHGEKTRPIRLFPRLFGISGMSQYALYSACKVPDAGMQRRNCRTQDERPRQRVLRMYELPEMQFYYAFQTHRSVLPEMRMVPCGKIRQEERNIQVVHQS